MDAYRWDLEFSFDNLKDYFEMVESKLSLARSFASNVQKQEESDCVPK